MRTFVASGAAAVLALGCGASADGVGEPVHAPRTADERSAAAVFDRYVASVARGDARAACTSLIGEAAAAHRCDRRPEVPKPVRTVADEVGAVRVRDASGYDADAHLSAPIDPPSRYGSQLVMFLVRRDGAYVATEVFPGSYG